MKRERISVKDKQERTNAVSTLMWFRNFLYAHQRMAMEPRRALTPARALAHLGDQDVQELLGREQAGKVRRAAELLR